MYSRKFMTVLIIIFVRITEHCVSRCMGRLFIPFSSFLLFLSPFSSFFLGLFLPLPIVHNSFHLFSTLVVSLMLLSSVECLHMVFGPISKAILHCNFYYPLTNKDMETQFGEQLTLVLYSLCHTLYYNMSQPQ